MRRHGMAWLSACILLAVAPTAAWGDGVIINGVSPRSLARGGTNIGHYDNAAVIHDNPAGMTNVAGNGLVDLGFELVVTDFGYTDPDGHDGDSAVCPLPQLGFVRKSHDGVWAWGLGVYAPAGFSQNFDLPGPAPIGGDRHYKSYAALLKVLPGLACQVTDRLSIGGTFGVGISHAELEAPYFLQGPGPLAGTPTLIDAQGTGATPVWSLGLQYLLSESTTVGATYTSISEFNLDGNTRVTVPGLGSSTYDSTLEITWPQSVGLGMRHQLNCCDTISADAIWYDWSSSFDQLDVTLSNPSNPFFPAAVDRLPLDWRDSVSLRLGYERRVHLTDTFRCGYVYHRNPIPDATLTPFIQATMEHGVSLGYGWTCWEWEIDTAYMFLWGQDRDVVDSALIGDDFSNSHHSAYAHAVALSLIRHF